MGSKDRCCGRVFGPWDVRPSREKGLDCLGSEDCRYQRYFRGKIHLRRWNTRHPRSASCPCCKTDSCGPSLGGVLGILDCIGTAAGRTAYLGLCGTLGELGSSARASSTLRMAYFFERMVQTKASFNVASQRMVELKILAYRGFLVSKPLYIL